MMLIRFQTLKKIIKEELSKSTENMVNNFLSTKDPKQSREILNLFQGVYNLLDKSKKLPIDIDYGIFAGESDFLYQADGSFEFLINIVMSNLHLSMRSKTLENQNENIRKVVSVAIKAWIMDNGFVLAGDNIKKLKRSSPIIHAEKIY